MKRKTTTRILFLAIHPRNSAPSHRFRFEQYIPFFESNGFRCTYSTILPTHDARFYYAKSSTMIKIWIGIKAFLRRFKDLLLVRQYDIVFISRRAFLTEHMFFEWCISKLGVKIIFDLDDAVWIDALSDYNKKLGWLKGKPNTANIIKLSNLVIAGNSFLAKYSLQYTNKVITIPTAIDTEIFSPSEPKHKKKIIIGWSGSFSTTWHLNLVTPALKKVKEKYGDRIGFKIIGDPNYYNKELEVKGVPWVLKTEVEDLRELDIGIMPLVDFDFAWGKCGLKGLTYMALEIPTLMSPVGVNSEIIKHGENGFLCNNEDEWVHYLSILIDQPEKRTELGKAGRETVLSRYSILANRDKYIDAFNQLLN
ncbi:MAG: glycosyltransferase family 4 protein [Cyclobacteriaceae bacterium]